MFVASFSHTFRRTHLTTKAHKQLKCPNITPCIRGKRQGNLQTAFLANSTMVTNPSPWRIFPRTFLGCWVRASKTWNWASRHVTANLFISMSFRSNDSPHTPLRTLVSQRIWSYGTNKGLSQDAPCKLEKKGLASRMVQTAKGLRIFHCWVHSFHSLRDSFMY